MSFQSHNIALLKKLKAEMKSSEQTAIQKAKELSRYKEWDGIKNEFEKGRFSESLYKRAKERFGDKADSLRKELSEANSRTNFIKSKISRIIAQDPSLSCLLFFDDFDEQGRGDLLIKGKSVHITDNRTQYSDVILINSKNEILFTVRNKNDNFEPGKYCLPGGHIEEDEEPGAAAVRELEEETGISLKESQIQLCGQYFDRKSHINYFCAHYDGDPVVLDEREQQQFEWVSIDDVNDKPLLMNLKENFKNIIEIPKSILNPLADNAKKYYFSGDEITSEELLERLRVLEDLYKGFLEGKVFLQDYENKKNVFNLEKGCKIEDFLFIDSQGDFYWGASYNDLNKGKKPDPIGSIKTRKDGKYIKISRDKWVRYKESKYKELTGNLFDNIEISKESEKSKSKKIEIPEESFDKYTIIPIDIASDFMQEHSDVKATWIDRPGDSKKWKGDANSFIIAREISKVLANKKATRFLYRAEGVDYLYYNGKMVPQKELAQKGYLEYMMFRDPDLKEDTRVYKYEYTDVPDKGNGQWYDQIGSREIMRDPNVSPGNAVPFQVKLKQPKKKDD